MQLLKHVRPKIIIGLAGAVFIALAAILLTPSSAPAQPVISWVPELLNETVLAGETKTVSVSFTASQELGAVEVRVVPELEPYVRTEPTSFTNITAGQEVSLNIIISAATDATTQVVEGTIQIRNAGRPPRNFARPLPVTINVSGLPPDPGEAGKATLEGIDSDGDGVRDDIQRHIALTYQDSERTRAVLTQYAKVHQAGLLVDDNKSASRANAHEIGRAIECLYYIRPDDARAVLVEMIAQVLNTDERSKAEFRYDAQLSGEVFTSSGDNRTGCDFNPDTMRN